MTKTELVAKVAEKSGLTKVGVRTIIDAMMDKKGLIPNELKRGGRVTISGFGTFHLRTRAARKARNPKTGASVKVAKRSYPAFKPSKTLKEALKK